MIIQENESLEKYTTFRMGGTARQMYFPESTEELQRLVKEQPNLLNHIISGGSNLLINDEKEFDKVLCLRSFNTAFEDRGEGVFYIGASIRLQAAIRSVNEAGYGGIEYLFSVPGLIGGAVYMNAGRGKKHNMCISDYILQVEVLTEEGKIIKMKKEDCDFKYRSSIFHNRRKDIILGVEFQFPPVAKEEAERRIQERIDLCKQHQDNSAPNYGTVFCQSNRQIMALMKLMGKCSKKGCTYSGKTTNWMLNRKGGTFAQAVALLKRVEKLHALFGKKCRREVIVWD